MARRLIKRVRFGKCEVTIHKDSFAGEYVVRQKIGTRVTGGKKDGGYFTDDKKDARSTAASMIRNLRKKKTCR